MCSQTAKMSLHDYFEYWDNFLQNTNSKEWYEDDEKNTISNINNSDKSGFIMIKPKISKSKIRNKNEIFTGRIIKYDSSRKYGFIQSSKHGKTNIFFHLSKCQSNPRIGSLVNFNIEKTEKGLSCTKVITKN
tara:strand:- start:60 stop:455 length:396 start_codon:yes stop_codon:yes gene_type:complete